MKRLSVVVPALLIIVMFGMVHSAAAQEDVATVVQRFFEARNRHDVEGALALVTDDFRFVGGPHCTPANPCVGKDALREEIEKFIEDNAQVTIVGELQVSGPRVQARTEGRADSFRAAGVERIVNNVTMELRDGKLASSTGVPDASDPQTTQYLAHVRATVPSGMPNTGSGGLHDEASSGHTVRWLLLGLSLMGALYAAPLVRLRRPQPR